MTKTIKILALVILTAVLFGTFLALTSVIHSHAKITTSTYERTIGEITNIDVDMGICYVIVDEQVYAIDDVYEPNSTAVMYAKGDIVEIVYKDTGTIKSIISIAHR